jgi:hypothetical protein
MFPVLSSIAERKKALVARTRQSGVQHRKSLFAWLIMTLFCVPPIQASAAETTGALLDECIAGIEANLALIEHGTATYRINDVVKRRGNLIPQEQMLKVIFDDRRHRFEWHKKERSEGSEEIVVEHVIIDPERVIEYWPPIGGVLPANGHFVAITRNSNNRRALMEPSQQRLNCWGVPPTFVWEIGWMKKTAPDHLTARRDAQGMIEISFQPPSVEVTRGVYWLSPEQGYGLVRANEWITGWDGDEPSSTYAAEFQNANNGAWVVAHRQERDRVPRDGALVHFHKHELWLDEIDLITRPADATFTIDGIGLPAGARIRDMLNGREYRYGIPAVDGQNIDVTQATGPMALRSWLGAFNTALGGVLLIWLGNRAARFYDRRLTLRRAKQSSAI